MRKGSQNPPVDALRIRPVSGGERGIIGDKVQLNRKVSGSSCVAGVA